MTVNRVYCHGRLAAADVPLEDLSAHVATPGTVVWVDLVAPQRAELELVAKELDLHDLAVEDATGRRQRPKLDRYDTHLFLSAFEARFDVHSGRVELHEVAAFVTPTALVTVRKGPDFAIEEVAQRWDAAADLSGHGVAFLLYGLLDHVVESHMGVVQALDDATELLEDLLFEDRPHSAQVQRRSFELRKSLVLLRRVALPMRDVIGGLQRHDWHTVDPAMAPYFRDLEDHVLRVAEWTESLRDLVATVLETNLTMQGNHLNTITKQVTSWAAIIAVPTAITGFYGQNVAYPGYGTAIGFAVSSLAILVASLALYLTFRRAGWL